MASAERTLLLLHSRPSPLLSSIHSPQHLKSSPHSHSLRPISLTNAFLPSLLSNHGLEKRVSHRRKPITIQCRLPARDMVLDFGRHRGKMMGTLPSTYLRWMAKDPEGLPIEKDWPSLAKEVLLDPVYRDRMEWEIIEDGLPKSRYPNKKSGNGTYNYLRLATRFGWDLTVPWKGVDVKLLGTSKGGRIPRTKDNPNPNIQHDYYLQKKAIVGPAAELLASENTKDRNLVSGKSIDLKARYGVGDENGYTAELLKRREERIVRQRARVVVNKRPRPEQRSKDDPIFPGRGALLRKVAEVQAVANTPKWLKM